MCWGVSEGMCVCVKVLVRVMEVWRLDAVGFALVFVQQFAVDDVLEAGCTSSLLGLFQVLQVVMGLTHPRLLPLLSAPEK